MAEAWRNLTAVGARPLALTDNMNFGNPERPEIMGQFAAAIRGMAAACEALDFPVVSGNVSLYNETRDLRRARDPADAGDRRPRRAGRCRARRSGIALRPWLDIVLVGATKGWLGQSLWLREIAGREDGAPPPVDLAAERAQRRFRPRADPRRHVRACHDVSDGGAAGRGGGDGDGRPARRAGCSPARATSPATPSGSARTRAATCSPCPTPAR